MQDQSAQAERVSCSVTKLEYGSGGQTVVVDFEDGAAGMPNGSIGSPSRIYGEYGPYGPGKVWVIRLHIKGVEYPATLNGEGGWHIEIPADVFTADSNEAVAVAVATCNGVDAYHGTGETVSTGQNE